MELFCGRPCLDSIGSCDIIERSRCDGANQSVSKSTDARLDNPPLMRKTKKFKEQPPNMDPLDTAMHDALLDITHDSDVFQHLFFHVVSLSVLPHFFCDVVSLAQLVGSAHELVCGWCALVAFVCVMMTDTCLNLRLNRSH